MEESKILYYMPTELLYRIAGHVDRGSLRSLSLVNHTFCGTAQRELFKEIHICYIVCSDGPMECYPGHTSRGAGFLAQLTSSPHLAPYIQDLQINLERCAVKVHIHWPQASLTSIIRCLTNLQRLLIPCPPLTESPVNLVSWSRLEPAIQAAIRHSLQSPLLLEADLRGFQDVPPDVFKNCLALRHLSIDALAIQSQLGGEHNNNSESPLTPSLTKNIKFLELGLPQFKSSPSLDNTASYLLAPRCTISIQQLCFLVISFPLKLHILSDILSHCPESLEYLSFVTLPETRSYYTTSGDNKGIKKHSLPPLDLSTLPNLRILVIRSRIEAPGPINYFSSLPWIRETIDTILPSHLEKVILEVNMRGFPFNTNMTILTVDWSDISRALLGAHGELKFHNLTTVKLKLRKLSPNWDSIDMDALQLRRMYPFVPGLLKKLKAHKDFVPLHSEHLQNLHGQILSIS